MSFRTFGFSRSAAEHTATTPAAASDPARRAESVSLQDWHESAWALRDGLEVVEIDSVLPATAGWEDDPITVPAHLA